MMYWGLSVIANSPLMPWRFAAEFYNVQHRGSIDLSAHAVQACGQVACATQARDMPIAVVHSAEGPGKRIFTDYPTEEEWAAFERGSVVQDAYGMMYVMIDALI